MKLNRVDSVKCGTLSGPSDVVPLIRERRFPCYRLRPARARRSWAAAAC